MKKNIAASIPSQLRFGQGTVDKSKLTENKIFGVYFSAHWCPPCRKFTPLLTQWYKNVNKDKKQIEIVFWSCDHDESQFEGYYKEMPWLALPFEGDSRNDIQYDCDVTNIPAFFIFNSKGDVIDETGAEAVMGEGDAAINGFLAKA